MPQDTLIPQSKDKKFNATLLWPWLLILAALVALSFVLTKFCEFKPWWLLTLLLIDYLLILIVNYVNKFTKKFWWLFGILLAGLPIIVLVFTAAWAWWLWLLVIGLYVLTLIFYFIGLLSEGYWAVCLPLTLFLLLMLIVMNYEL